MLRHVGVGSQVAEQMDSELVYQASEYFEFYSKRIPLSYAANELLFYFLTHHRESIVIVQKLSFDLLVKISVLGSE